MRVLSHNEKLWHTPLTLTLSAQQQKIIIPIDKRCLFACKHKLALGHSAELFNNGNITVLYTKLMTNKNAAVAVHVKDQHVGGLLVHGRGFEETHSDDGVHHVSGLAKLADAIVSRHATVPDCAFTGDIATPLPPYQQLKFCKDVLRCLKLSLPVPTSEHESKIFQAMQRERLIDRKTSSAATSRFRYTGLAGSHLMLKFNNNFISRMVSCHKTNSLFVARSICLNVAAAQKFVTPSDMALLGSTLETVQLHPDTMTLLQSTAEHPCTRVCYLDFTGTKQKIPVYVLQQPQVLSLATSGINLPANMPCYVAFTERNAPILLGDVKLTNHCTANPAQTARDLRLHGEVFTRRWLHAACTQHPELHNALCIFAKAAAPKQGSVYAYNPVPALDMWATHEINQS